MSGGFNNPIVGGGGALVYPAIHSPNFVTGSAGWSINKNGTAEFNSLTVRNGTVISGVFLLYSSAIPAKGNLVVAFAPVAGGTDAVGNVYPQGFNFGTWSAAGALVQHYGIDLSGRTYYADSSGSTKEITILPSGDTTGVSDRTTIQGQLNLGANVRLIAGHYYTDRPIQVPSGIALLGTATRLLGPASAPPGTILTATATMSAAGNPGIVEMTAGSGSELGNLVIDGSLAAAGIDGLQAIGALSDFSVHDVLISAPPRNGFNAIFSSGNPFSARLRKVNVRNAGSSGFVVSNMTDTTFEDCEALGCGATGWYLFGMNSSTLLGCRAEFSSGFGFQIDGGNQGNSPQGLSLVGCSTDRNVQHGVWVSATGTTPIIISGHRASRDGSGSLSAGWAGIATAGSMTNPLIIDGLIVNPGTNDDGTGNDSPQYGLNINTPAPTYVSVSNALLHGVTAGLNGSVTNGRAIATRTGAIGSPSAITLVADTA